jgi:uncharacterized protein YciI
LRIAAKVVRDRSAEIRWVREVMEMCLRFAYFYFMGGDPDRIRATAPRHVAHWRGLGLTDYLGGPFEDRTSGLITFSAGDATEAQHAVETDPFVVESLIGSSWLKHWIPE